MPDSRAAKKRAFYALMAGLTAALVFCGAFLWGMQANVRAETEASNATVATTNAQTLAEQVKSACSAGQLVVDERNLCAKAAEIADQPADLVPGPPGPKGETGSAGKDSAVPGPQGKDGKDGADGDTGDTGLTGATGADGPPGLTGAPGGDSTAPGPAGPAGTAGSDGVPGADGANGTNGRGIISVICEGIGDTSYWLVTYDDGTTQTSGGPCRIEAAAAPVPAPTDSP